MLLHGFPGTGRLWRHQVPALTEAGFQVIVPDLRGYGRSSKPDAVESYSLPLLAGDVLAILAERQISRPHVLGHDWGAALAWVLASLEPERSTTWLPMPVGNPSPSSAPSNSGRSRGTCCCSSSPASPSAG